jgi:hypothetical protein
MLSVFEVALVACGAVAVLAALLAVVIASGLRAVQRDIDNWIGADRDGDQE